MHEKPNKQNMPFFHKIKINFGHFISGVKEFQKVWQCL